MGAVDVIAIVAVALTLGGAIFYIVRAKRRGQKCIGCPYAKKCNGCCGTCTENGEGAENKSK